MADDPAITSLAFDPNYMGARTEFSGAQQPRVDGPGASVTMDPANQNGGDIWARVQDAAKRGLISPAQVEAIGKKLGYNTNGALGGNYATGVKSPDYTNSGTARALGETAGNILGRAGTAIYDKATAPTAPGAPLDINPPENDITSANKRYLLENDGRDPSGMQHPPSPAWNQ